LWGVRGFFYDGFVSTDDSITDIHEILKGEGAIKPGDLVVNVASIPIQAEGMTNMVKLSLMS
jgi:pyruvate kinase